MLSFLRWRSRDVDGAAVQGLGVFRLACGQEVSSQLSEPAFFCILLIERKIM
jgi:hypothetical protein